MLLLLAVALLFSSSAVIGTERAHARRYSLDQILDAIRTTESGGCKDEGRDATGDGGRAIGPYQVHRSHWQDSRQPGRFEDCRDPAYARREVIAYWERWCPEALARRDAEVLARVHNGGPNGARKEGTLPFWRRVRAALERDDGSTARGAGRRARHGPGATRARPGRT